MLNRLLLSTFMFLLNIEIFAVVNTRLTLESHNHNTPVPGTGTLIINVEAQSTTILPVDISTFQNAFNLDANLRSQVQQIVFSDQNFPASNYSNTEDFNSNNGRVRYEYDFISGTRSSVSGFLSWTLIVRVTIRYTMTDATSTISWHNGGPQYFVTDENNNSITGNEQPIPAGLINIPMPVELNFFSANIKNNKVQLIWQTLSEVNNVGFEIERYSTQKETLKKWEKIGFVEGNGNSNSPKSYSFTDYPSGGIIFLYRLKQIDNDGAFSYSNEIKIELSVTQFELYQNYPNPFNPVTNIKFSLPDNSHVRLDIFNILGEHIITLIDTEMETGYHNILFDAGSIPLASGTYIYLLNSDNFLQVNKMVVTK